MKQRRFNFAIFKTRHSPYLTPLRFSLSRANLFPTAAILSWSGAVGQNGRDPDEGKHGTNQRTNERTKRTTNDGQRYERWTFRPFRQKTPPSISRHVVYFIALLALLHQFLAIPPWSPPSFSLTLVLFLSVRVPSFPTLRSFVRSFGFPLSL